MSLLQVILIILSVFICLRSENENNVTCNRIEKEIVFLQKGVKKTKKYDELDKYESCHGEKQSPIKINRHKTKKLSSSKTFAFSKNYKKFPKKMHLAIKNNSLHLGFNYDKKSVPTVRGTGLKGTYKLNHIVFHWGQSSNGAEHSIDDEVRSMEVQLVHVNTKYKNFEDSVKHEDGVFIYSTLYKLEEGEGTSAIELVSINLPDYANKPGNKNYAIGTFPLSWLMSDLDKYFVYDGSLTYPPCFEVVTWMIPSRSRKINSEQLRRFRKLYKKHEGLKHNIRPQQPWNGRIIYEK